MSTPRRQVRVACAFGVGLLAIAALLGLPARGRDEPKNEPGTYVRPVPIKDEAVREVLETMGTTTIGFEYKIPADKTAFFILVARDDRGKVIKDLSGIQEVSPGGEGEANRGALWMTRIDPAGFTEGYKGKVRWAYRLESHGGSATMWDTWQPDHFGATKKHSSWPKGKAIEAPEVGKEYVLWEVRAYPSHLHGIFPDSPTTFHYQIRFKMGEKGNDPPGMVGERDFEDEPPKP